jgi:hypothetical protein
MIIRYTDRVIRCYSWVSTSQNASTNISNVANNSNPSLANANNKNSTSKGSMSSQVANNSYSFQEIGKIVLEQSWEFSELV